MTATMTDKTTRSRPVMSISDCSIKTITGLEKLLFVQFQIQVNLLADFSEVLYKITLRLRQPRAPKQLTMKNCEIILTCMPHAVARDDVGWKSRHTNFASSPGWTPFGCRKRPEIT